MQKKSAQQVQNFVKWGKLCQKQGKFKAILGPKTPKHQFLTILVVKTKFWDHFVVVTIPILPLKSGLRFWFKPLKKHFNNIAHLPNSASSLYQRF